MRFALSKDALNTKGASRQSLSSAAMNRTHRAFDNARAGIRTDDLKVRNRLTILPETPRREAAGRAA